MLTELSREHFARVSTLFAPLAEYNVSIGGVLAGYNPGFVAVDDPDAPRTAFMSTPEGSHLAGEIENPAFWAAFPAYMRDALFARREWERLYLVLTSEWGAALADLVGSPPVAETRRHYVCRTLQHDWRAYLPEGFTVQRLDAELLAQAAWMPDWAAESWAHINRWAETCWGSHAAFLENGFGFVTLHDGEIVSWSLADGRDDTPDGARCEIGIHTLRDYRRRGLAAITAAAAVEHALTQGFAEVGWHCSEDNPGSFHTAERVGFRLERRYTNYFVYAREALRLREMAWQAYVAGRYAETVRLNEQVFALDTDTPDYCYHLSAVAAAALNDTDAALRYLNAAVDRGWADADLSRSCEAFGSLHGAPGWAAVLARMEIEAEDAGLD